MISFILPVYNCFERLEEFLPGFVRQLAEGDEPWEVIVVDDGSRDGGRIRDLVVANGCILVRNEMNRGKGYALRRGFGQAKGDLQMFMDGDFPFFPDVPRRMIEAFGDERVDLVVGDRSLADSIYPKDIGVIRRLGSGVLSFFVGRCFTPGIFDTQCGIKGFRRRVAAELFPLMTVDGFAIDLELLHVAIARKYRIGRIAVGTVKQESSTVRVLRDGVETVGSIIRIGFNRLRGRYRTS